MAPQGVGGALRTTPSMRKVTQGEERKMPQWTCMQANWTKTFTFFAYIKEYTPTQLRWVSPWEVSPHGEI